MLQFDLHMELREFSFNATGEAANGVTVVEGPSGAGKTTLLRLLAGLIRPKAGAVALDGRTLTDTTRNVFVPPAQRNIAILFQEYALFPHFDVAANVAYGLRARNVPRAEREERVMRELQRLDIGTLARARVTELSGGQRQRVALARALVVKPTLFVSHDPGARQLFPGPAFHIERGTLTQLP